MSVTSLVNKLKDNNEDFEWYPTTIEIIKDIYKDLTKKNYESYSILDVGAGNGKLFDTLEDINKKDREAYTGDEYSYKHPKRFSIHKKYAIEKSKILIENMSKDIFIIGTDFYEQSLIDKNLDILFCNPPYSDFNFWAEKILKETNCKVAYLVIPERWENNENIKQIISKRGIKHSVLGTYSFEDSEDRKARANVNLIRFDIREDRNYSKTDAFSIWFEENFKIEAETDRYFHKSTSEATKENIAKNEVMSKENMIENLVKLYNSEMEKLLSNYKALESLDYSLLRELNVNMPNLIEALKEKITSLKNVYWQTLFDRFKGITERLTSKSRDSLLKTLLDHTSVDFTESNIYAVVIWVVKNTNEYMDKQLLEIYMDISDKDNIKLYKSNKRVLTDDWRFNKREMTHYTLDYRIITSSYSCFPYYEYEKINGLGKGAYNLIKDMMIIGNNLGFNLLLEDLDKLHWEPGSKNEIYYYNNSKKVLFCDLKVYKNNNIHFRFAPDFMMKLNIEASRLNKWIKEPKEAVEEFDISIEDAEKMFGSNNTLKIEKSNVRGLLA